MFSAELLFAIMNSNAIQDERDIQPEFKKTLSSWFFAQNLPEELETVSTTTQNTSLGNAKKPF